jgi:Tfp pilus assembly protein PilV
MNTCCTKRGQSLLEVMLAAAIMILSIATTGLLLIDTSLFARYDTQRIQAVLLMEEGFTAVTSIRNTDFDNLPAGTYGIAQSGSAYILSGTFDIYDIFQREVTIADIDIDTKEISVQVTWTASGNRQGSVSAVQYLTDWRQTEGDIEVLAVDSSSAVISGAASEILDSIILTSTGSGPPLKITNAVLSWDAPALLTEVLIGGKSAYSNTPGVPTGTLISLSGVNIKGGKNELFQAMFTGSVLNTEFLIGFQAQDQSAHYSLIEPLQAPPSDEASYLAIDTNSARATGQGKRFVRGIKLTNTHTTQSITITTMEPSWNVSALLIAVEVNGNPVWSGASPSASSIDIADIGIPPEVTVTMDLEFDSSMQNSALSILYTMADASQISTGIFNP